MSTRRFTVRHRTEADVPSRRCFLGTIGTALLAPLWPRDSAAQTGDQRLAVVVGKSSPLFDLSVQDLKNLYRGDQLTAPGGKRLLPFSLLPGLPERVGFDRVVLGWSPADHRLDDDAVDAGLERRAGGQS